MPFPGFGAAFQSQGGWPGQQQQGGPAGGSMPPWMQGMQMPQNAGQWMQPGQMIQPGGQGGWGGQQQPFLPPGSGYMNLMAHGQPNPFGEGQGGPTQNSVVGPGGAGQGMPPMMASPGGAPQGAPWQMQQMPMHPMQQLGQEPSYQDPGFPTKLAEMVRMGQITPQNAMDRAQLNHPEWAQKQPGFQQPMGARLSPGGGQTPPIFAGGGGLQTPPGWGQRTPGQGGDYQGGGMGQNKPMPDRRPPIRPPQQQPQGQWRGAGQQQRPQPQIVTGQPVPQPMPQQQLPQMQQRDPRMGGGAYAVGRQDGGGGGGVLGERPISITPNDPRYFR